MFVTTGSGITCRETQMARPYINLTSPSAGLVRYNGTCLEVYDGSFWHPIHASTMSVALEPNYAHAIEWAMTKQREEQALFELAKISPAIKDLMDQIKEKQDQLEMVKLLLSRDKTLESK